MTIPGEIVPRNAVCEQREWDVMERSRPGFHQLLRYGITSEAEAERWARGTSGDTRSTARGKRKSREGSLGQFVR